MVFVHSELGKFTVADALFHPALCCRRWCRCGGCLEQLPWLFADDVKLCPAPTKTPNPKRRPGLCADIVKLTDEEAEWLYGIPPQEALDHPEKVCVFVW